MHALLRLFPCFNHGKIAHKVIRAGLKKSPRYFQGAHGRKGKPAWNKGIILQADQLLQRPGFGRIRKSTPGYLQVYHEGRYQSLSHLIWQQHHGQPVPDDMLIRYLDGNPENVDISNLALMKRSDNMRQHSFSNYPKEIREVHIITKQINRIINE